jgi:hypothetical protein
MIASASPQRGQAHQVTDRPDGDDYLVERLADAP